MKNCELLCVKSIKSENKMIQVNVNKKALQKYIKGILIVKTN